MNNLNNDIVYKIIYKMLDVLNTDKIESLKNVINIVLNDYEISKKEKSLVTYNDGEIDFFMKRFLVTKKVEGCTDRTIQMYGTTITKILYKINKPIKDINSDDILVYLANRDVKDKVSKVTQDNELRFLRTFFSFLLSEEYINKNPCLKLKPIKAAKKKKYAFTEIEIERIRNACKNNKERALIELLLSTGCRASEIVQIKYNDIRDNRVTILGKGNKERIVYINAKAQIAVENYLTERKDENIYLFPKMLSVIESKDIRKKRNINVDYKNPIFILEEGHSDKGYPNSIVKRIGKRAGVVNTHTHRFRRTCATLALKRGMPILQVSKMLGHEQISTTQIYLDISEDELEQSHKKYVI